MEYDTLSIMLDCSRNSVANKEFLKNFIDTISSMGYNELQLYIEDIYEVEGEPYFGYLRGRYSKEEIKEVDKYAKEKGVELVPAVQLLGHLSTIFEWRKYNIIRDRDDCLCPDLDETYVFLENLIKSLREMFSTNKINIGMDETESLGKGQHLHKFGYEDPKKIYLRHLNKVAELLKKYDFKPMMWGDMFIKYDNNGVYYNYDPIVKEETKKLKPENVHLIYWDYYNLDKKLIKGMVKGFSEFDEDVIWAGGAWSWNGFAPNNDFTIETFKKMFPVMRENGVRKFILTMWGDNGGECSRYALLPTIFMFSEMAKGNYDIKNIKEKFFDKYNIKYDDYLLIDILNNPEKNKTKKPRTAAKYMLYDDPFMGIFESTVGLKGEATYKYLKTKLNKMSKDNKFGYLFNTLSKLSAVLEYKYTLSTLTRKYYKENNKEEMSKLVIKYDKLVKRIEEFYSAFKVQWQFEAKSYGFEVETARIGGLIQRVKDCSILLKDWIKNGTKIEMLDGVHLPFDESYDKFLEDGEPIQFNSYGSSYSRCVK